MTAAPTISVIIPTHNRGDRIVRAVDSILIQSFHSYEIVIVDDGSTDHTAEAVQGIQDPRVRYVAQHNQGAAAARNRGVQFSRGRYLTFLDSDDRVLPGWLETMVDALTDHGADLVCCGVEVVGPEDGAGLIRLPSNMGDAFNNMPGPLLAGAYALRKEVFERVGGFDAKCSTGQHTDFALRLAELSEHQPIKTQAVMSAYLQFVQHPGERLSQNARKRLDGTLYLLTKHQARLKRNRWGLADYWSVAAVSAHKLGQRHLASSYFLEAARLTPYRPKLWLRYLMSVTGLVPSGIWQARRSTTAQEIRA